MTNFHPSLYLDDLQYEVHQTAVKRGFWEHDDGSHQIDSEKIALMHSEISEALSALRDGDMEHVEEELCDCIIRIADYAEGRGLRLSSGIIRVLRKNENRPPLHGRKF